MLSESLKNCAQKGGFNLTKFTSNSEEVLKSIPDEEKRKNVSVEALTFGKLSEDKALGNPCISNKNG